ncbi:MAG: penicillin-binding protein 1B [Candidatus Competibacter sp.]|nr:penicillin-binding protein 1B [Candidatus Competibacter sp.]MDG4604809.1 penicillin-binding protein 1B [Candidatus Contendobacter sp.]HRD50738.1 penicillin-binding protein 1B [Candidatus Contendobacter sp.]
MFSLLLSLLLGGVLLVAFGLGVYMLYLDAVIRTEFDQKRWAMPAKVYARPLELFAGMPLSAEAFVQELKVLGYHDVNCPVESPAPLPATGKPSLKPKPKPKPPEICVPPPGGGSSPTKPGSYARQGEVFEVVTRDFVFWDAAEPTRKIRVGFAGEILVDVTSLDGQEAPGLLRLDPPEIAGIYPAHYEDRILLKGKDLPPALVDTLLAVEDRSFFEHAGINPKGIFRAMVVNLRAGRTVQGGSTLTQQLVKNLFLSNERSFKRKINEILMAILIDARYGKDDILEAYSNAIYLGQDGSRAIHGFGLASQFFFGKALDDLDLHQFALLVGIIKGPSLYDPRKHPDRAKDRRALVLDVMAEQNLISAEDAAIAKEMPLDVTPKAASGITAYPAFLELVQRQLRQYYKSEDLTSEGLRVFTTLDPRVQAKAENTLANSLSPLEKSQPKARPLQGAAIVTDTQTGEVLAMVGDREPKAVGFNRALDAKRLAGSLIKPVTYLTALEQPDRYTLMTRLNDSPLVYTSGGQHWTPGNYDKRYHGRVTLRDALARSYNIPAVRVGLDMDVIKVVEMLQRLGLERELKPYPSLLLGAFEVSPFEIAQIYATIAGGGFRIPLRAIREVTDATGKSLQHYALDVEKAVEPGPAYLVTNAMQQVVKAGTASAMKSKLSPDLNIAGKTGTTDDFRDTWFAGFSGDRLAVVWLGRDDNKPTGLSGASGALRVWMDLMAGLKLEPLDTPPPTDVEEVWVDPHSGLRLSQGCRRGQAVPFLVGSGPQGSVSCGSAPAAPRRTVPDDSDSDMPADDAEGSGEMGDFFRRLMN